MSDRKPLTSAIKDFARHARNIKKLSDPQEIAEHIFKRLAAEGYRSKRNNLIVWLAYIKSITVLRTRSGGGGAGHIDEERQLHLWDDLDQVFDIRHVKRDPDSGERRIRWPVGGIPVRRGSFASPGPRSSGCSSCRTRWRRRAGGGMNASEHALAFNYLRELYDDERASIWLNKPHELLGWRKPIEARYVEVLALIDQIKTGACI